MIKKLLFLAISLGLAYHISRFTGGFDIPYLAAAAAFFLVLGVSFVRGTDALYIIAVAMLFSPEIGASTQTGRTAGEGAGLVVRLEDVLLIAIGVGWLLRTAYQKRRFGIARTSVNVAIVIYMVASIASTLLGVVSGSVKPMSGLFNNLKYFEYFFLFFMILAHVRRKESISRIVAVIFIVFFCAMIYGYTQIQFGGSLRVCAPFDSEPNTFGGYIVLIFCVLFGVALVDSRTRVRLFVVGLMLFSIPPLMFTLSRASYMALIAGILAFLAVSRQRILVGAVLVGIVGLTLVMIPVIPQKIQSRVQGTFQKGTEYHVKVAGVDLDPSASARIVSYREAIESWIAAPFFGHGVTGTHFIDGQFFRLLAETGIVGFAAFMYVLWRLMFEVWRIYKVADPPFLKGVCLGFFCGIFAMLAHGISANSFIIVRIAEPFWLMAGLILLIPRLRYGGDTVEPIPKPVPPENLFERHRKRLAEAGQPAPSPNAHRTP